MKELFSSLYLLNDFAKSSISLPDRIGWHLSYSLLLMFDLLSCSEEPVFSSLFLDIGAAAV